MAKVDAEAGNSKATAEAQGVTSYPTIKFFPAGSKEAVAYEGGRAEADFVSFLNEKAGTHRVVGGGLDVVAGTVDALDTVVAKFSAGASALSEVAAEAKASAATSDRAEAPVRRVLPPRLRQARKERRLRSKGARPPRRHPQEGRPRAQEGRRDHAQDQRPQTVRPEGHGQGRAVGFRARFWGIGGAAKEHQMEILLV